jgi:hypothetical protein
MLENNSCSVLLCDWLFLEHRNMPLESAVSLMMRSYEQWVAAGGDAATTAAGAATQAGRSAPVPGAPVSDVFVRPDDNIVRMLRMVIDGRNLVVEELDEIIGYFQEQRNRLAAARGIAPIKPQNKPTGCCSELHASPFVLCVKYRHLLGFVYAVTWDVELGLM